MRLRKVPSAIAEYTLGTMIVLVQVGVIRPLEDRALRKRGLPPAGRPGHVGPN